MSAGETISGQGSPFWRFSLGFYRRSGVGDACIVLDDLDKMGEQLELAQSILAESKPVAIAFHPDVLSKDVDLEVPSRERPRMLDQVDADRFVNEFPEISRGRRVIIYAGAEASR